MASGVFHHVEGQPIVANIRFSAAYTGPIATFPRFDTTIFARPIIPLNISRLETLRGARSALIAVGLEAGLALCLFAAWGIWHLLR